MDPLGIIGRTIETKGAPGYVNRDDLSALNAPANLQGRWTVEEYQPLEPSAYCYEPGYLLFREGCDPDNQRGQAFLPVEVEELSDLNKRIAVIEEA